MHFQTKNPLVATGTTAAIIALIVAGCSGPQPLSVAIRPADEAAYVQSLAAHANSPKRAFFALKASDTSQSIAQLEELDRQLSTTSNPFSARSDHSAVSRGAVIYKAHCVSCHGENSDGSGPAMPVPLTTLDFHSFSKRFAATIHGGAPKAWFQKINEGFTSETLGPDGKPLAMPAFGDVLAREQIWLTITYLQSLDMNAEKRGEGK